jgi:epoxyqueuosine reductase
VGAPAARALGDGGKRGPKSARFRHPSLGEGHSVPLRSRAAARYRETNQLLITAAILGRPPSQVDRPPGSFCPSTSRENGAYFFASTAVLAGRISVSIFPWRSPYDASLRQNQAMKTRSDTAWIEAHAKSLGFELCGAVRAEQFPELAKTEEWLARGFAGEMRYLADPRRREPASVMRGIRSVIVCALNYNTDLPRSTDVPRATRAEDPRGWISRYAWGTDYHQVLQGKLTALSDAMRARFDEPFEARVYADTGPVQERILAKYAGLGWLGKNTLLLNQRLGSFIFLGAILTTLDLAPTLQGGALPPPDLCGSCRRCIDACPTGAFVEPYVMDARRCISYLTIELRGPIPDEFREPMGRHVFGCDICQDVCPWNRRAVATTEDEFRPRSFRSGNSNARQEMEEQIAGGIFRSEEQCGTSLAAEESLFYPRLECLLSMDEAEFREVFRDNAIKRTKWRGLVRNTCVALGNSALPRGMPARDRILASLARLSTSEDAVIAESALWALSRIQRTGDQSLP